MKNSIDDVIRVCKERYGLEVNGNVSKYIAFLKRQQKAHNYNLNYKTPKASRNPYLYLNVLVDKLLLFSYLTGEIAIIAGSKGETEEKKISSVEDLYLLRPAEIGISGKGKDYKARLELKTDERLYNLVSRIQNRKVSNGLPNWSGHINELEEDSEIVKYFGQKINNKIVRRCISPNPLTGSSGGDKYGGRRIIEELRFVQMQIRDLANIH